MASAICCLLKKIIILWLLVNDIHLKIWLYFPRGRVCGSLLRPLAFVFLLKLSGVSRELLNLPSVRNIWVFTLSLSLHSLSCSKHEAYRVRISMPSSVRTVTLTAREVFFFFKASGFYVSVLLSRPFRKSNISQL